MSPSEAAQTGEFGDCGGWKSRSERAFAAAFLTIPSEHRFTSSLPASAVSYSDRP